MVSQRRFVWLWYQSVLVNFYPNLNSSLYHTDTLLVICLILLWFLLFYCFTVHYIAWYRLLDSPT